MFQVHCFKCGGAGLWHRIGIWQGTKGGGGLSDRLWRPFGEVQALAPWKTNGILKTGLRA